MTAIPSKTVPPALSIKDCSFSPSRDIFSPYSTLLQDSFVLKSIIGHVGFSISYFVRNYINSLDYINKPIKGCRLIILGYGL